VTLRKIGSRAFWYTAIALAIFLAIGTFVVLTNGADIARQWIFLAVFTGGLFWTTAKTSREWRRPGFWLAMTILVGAHLLLFIPLLRMFPEFPPIWFVPIIPVEAGSFAVILFLLFGRHRVR
jgi:hypothetical protein